MKRKRFIALPQMFTSIIIYIVHLLLRKIIFQYNFTLIRYYIADYLTLIVCIPLFVNIQVVFNIRKSLFIKVYEIIIYFILFSVYCEIIGPLISNKMTYDPIDFIFYLLGGIILYFSQKGNANVQNKLIIKNHNNVNTLNRC